MKHTSALTLLRPFSQGLLALMVALFLSACDGVDVTNYDAANPSSALYVTSAKFNFGPAFASPAPIVVSTPNPSVTLAKNTTYYFWLSDAKLSAPVQVVKTATVAGFGPTSNYMDLIERKSIIHMAYLNDPSHVLSSAIYADNLITALMMTQYPVMTQIARKSGNGAYLIIKTSSTPATGTLTYTMTRCGDNGRNTGGNWGEAVPSLPSPLPGGAFFVDFQATIQVTVQ